jgi:uncharacterized protein YxjI
VNFLISHKWGMGSRSVITDESGMQRFEIQRQAAFSRKLSLRDPMGMEVAVLSPHGLSTRYEILMNGQVTTVRSRGFLGKRFEIDSAAGRMEAQGNFSGRQYSITRGGSQAAAVTQLRVFRQQFAVEVSEAEDPALMLAVVLAIETIKESRQASAAGS